MADAFTLERLDIGGETDLGWGVARVVNVQVSVRQTPEEHARTVRTGQLHGAVGGKVYTIDIVCKVCGAIGRLVVDAGNAIGQFQHVRGCRVAREIAGISGEVTGQPRA